MSDINERLKSSSTSYGEAKLGGPFTLIDQNGKIVTEQNYKGKYSLMYFGFSHCPDICPIELDKIGEVMEKIGRCIG